MLHLAWKLWHTPRQLRLVIRCSGIRHGCVCVQATGKAEKQVDKASDKVGSAAKEVSHGIWLILLVQISDQCFQCCSCKAQALLHAACIFHTLPVSSPPGYSLLGV